QHVRQRLEPYAFGGLVVQLFGASEHRQYVDDIVLGLIVDGDALLLQRRLNRIVKELAQVGDREQGPSCCRILHSPTPRSLQTPVRHPYDRESLSPFVLYIGAAACRLNSHLQHAVPACTQGEWKAITSL